jgi:hypothetical protein
VVEAGLRRRKAVPEITAVLEAVAATTFRAKHRQPVVLGILGGILRLKVQTVVLTKVAVAVLIPQDQTGLPMVLVVRVNLVLLPVYL